MRPFGGGGAAAGGFGVSNSVIFSIPLKSDHCCPLELIIRGYIKYQYEKGSFYVFITRR